MQLQQLLQPLQEGTFRFARTFLNDNPDLLQKYVSTGNIRNGKRSFWRVK